MYIQPPDDLAESNFVYIYLASLGSLFQTRKGKNKNRNFLVLGEMGKKNGVILVAVALAVAAILDDAAAAANMGRNSEGREQNSMEIIQKKLKLLNKPAIKTIHVFI